MIKLSILIPVHESHWKQCDELLDHLNKQFANKEEVEIIPFMNKGEFTKGYYRNLLLTLAKGEYVCFIDADDWTNENYIQLLLKGIKTQPTHISLKGVITTNGQNPKIFEHSNKYDSWKTMPSGDVEYLRTISHLNCIKSSIATQFKFPEINHGEDHAWSELICKSGLLNKEYYIDTVLYHYNYIPK